MGRVRALAVVGIWVLLALVGAWGMSGLGRVVNANEAVAPGSPSSRAQSLLQKAFPAQKGETLLLAVAAPRPGGLVTGAGAEYLRQLAGRMAAAPHVSAVARPVLDRRGQVAYLVVRLRSSRMVHGLRNLPDLIRRAKSVGRPAGIRLWTTGSVPLTAAFNEAIARDLSRAEWISLPITGAVLFGLFRSPLAALLPLLTSVMGITVALGSLTAIGHLVSLSGNVEDVAAMIGLGVGIDYSLMMVSRFRDERERGADIAAAVRAMLRHAGRAVLFSGSTVAVGFLVMATVPQPILRSVALGALITVLTTMLTALILLPAVLTLLGHRLDWLALPRRRGERGHLWRRVASGVMGHPWPVLILTLLPLLLLLLPLGQMRFWNANVAGLGNAGAQAGYLRLKEAFGAGHLTPDVVLLRSGRSLATAQRLRALRDLGQTMARLPGVAHVAGPVPASVPDLALTAGSPLLPRLSRSPLLAEGGKVAVFYVTATTAPSSQASFALARRLGRVSLPPALAGSERLVGGQAAVVNDLSHQMSAAYPRVLLGAAFATYLLLLPLFRSVLLPLKAVVVNLVSVNAGLGLVVLLFQKGWAAGLLHFEPPGALIWSTPLLLLSTLFGLSTDYEVFLLTRVQELVQRGMATRTAVAEGLAQTGGMITGAAFLMVTVFLAFAATPLEFMKELGVGLALAVLIDASLIRVLVVPAVMVLLGEWNWWWPGRGRP